MNENFTRSVTSVMRKRKGKNIVDIARVLGNEFDINNTRVVCKEIS